MTYAASIFYSLYRPSKCERRVYLRAQREKESEPSEFQKLIEKLGIRHEREHLSSFTKVADFRDGSIEERLNKTLTAIENGVELIYQGVLQAKLPGTQDYVIGVPDFMVNDGDSYRIRDCKLARHADEERHPEILRQLELYGWLFEQNFDKPPSQLEAYLGDRILFETAYDGGSIALEILREIRSISNLGEELYSPVGWSKCGGCGFGQRCWKIAEDSKDIAILPAVDQSMSIALRKKGVKTIDELLAKFDAEKLSNFERPHGQHVAKIGKSAELILLQAEAVRDNKEIRRFSPDLPESNNWVMFDLEGMPPYFQELDKAYLWGTQVFGAKPGRYMAALAAFGPEGDKQGWHDLLSNCNEIFLGYGDIPFVHWAPYEKTKLKMYIKRFGDKDGLAVRVLENCIDLLPFTRDSLVLPLPSYSLKVVEKYVGFERTMEEYGGDWSMAKYIEAVETEDEKLRQENMSQIAKYNEEDLKATWAVLQWLKSKSDS